MNIVKCYKKIDYLSGIRIMRQPVDQLVQDMTQDFGQKIAIVVREDLLSWQAMNTIAHISGYLGNKNTTFLSDEYFVTDDGIRHPRNSQYAIIVLKNSEKGLRRLMQRVRESGLLYHGFIREMIETTDDGEIQQILTTKKDSEIEYFGIGIFGPIEKVQELTQGMSLWK